MNLIDILIAAALLVSIAAAVAVILIRKRKGKSNCSGCCDNCPYSCKTPHPDRSE